MYFDEKILKFWKIGADSWLGEIEKPRNDKGGDDEEGLFAPEMTLFYD